MVAADRATGEPAGGVRLDELARVAAAELRGDPALVVSGVHSLERANACDLSFVVGRRYLEAAHASRAGALLVPRELAGEPWRAAVLVVDDPHAALAGVLERVYPPVPRPPGVHPTAVLGERTAVAAGAHVGAYATVGDDTVVSGGAVIHSHVAIGRWCRIGAGVELHPHVVVYDRTVVESGTIVHAGAVLGADGFGFADGSGGRKKIPQVGRVVLEAGVEVGANSTIDRATLDETRVGRGSKIDNLVQVGHNVTTGEGCILCAQAGIAGSARLGDRVIMGGQSGVSDHVVIGSGVRVAGKSAVFSAVADDATVAGSPAQPIAAWRRQVALAGRLADRLLSLRRRLAELERRAGVGEPEGGGDG